MPTRRTPVALRQPHQIAGEIVAMDEHARPRGERRQHPSSAAATAARASSGGGAPNAAGHHQSRIVPQAAAAIASASQSGSSGGGASCIAASASTAASNRTGVLAGVHDRRIDSVAEILDQQQAGRLVGRETPPGRISRATARCAPTRRKGRTSSGGGASISTAGRGPPCRRRYRRRLASCGERLGHAPRVAMPAEEAGDRGLAAHATRPSRSGQPDSTTRRASPRPERGRARPSARPSGRSAPEPVRPFDEHDPVARLVPAEFRPAPPARPAARGRNDGLGQRGVS